MQTFISKYGLAAHLALLAVTPLFLSPFCDPSTIAASLLWLSVSALVWLLMEPSRRANERLHQARQRVRFSILTDPLFWLFLLLVVFAGIRAVNGGIAKVYDLDLHKWILRPPSAEILPGHAGDEGLLPFATVVALLVIVEGCRQALGKSARIALVSMIAIFTGIAAIVQVLACRMDHAGAILLSGAVRATGENGEAIWSWTPQLVTGENIVSPFFTASIGTAYGLVLLAAVVSAAGLFECKWNKLLLLFSFAIGAAGTGLFYFSTPFVFVLFLFLTVILVLLCSIYLVLTARTSVALRYLMTVVLGGLVPFLVIMCVAPAGMTEAHAGIFTGAVDFSSLCQPSGYWDLRQALSGQAADFWKEGTWVGRGLGAFPLDCWLRGASGVTQAAAPLNGWWLLMAERGIFGVLAVALPVAFLSISFVIRLIGARGRHTFLPLCALGIVAILATAVTAFFDASFLRAETLLAAGTFFALGGSAFPRRVKKADEDEAIS